MNDSSPITHITDYPKVSIIILNWNGLEDAKYLDRCPESK